MPLLTSAVSDGNKNVPFTNNDGGSYFDLVVKPYEPFKGRDLRFGKMIISYLNKDSVILIKKTERLNHLFTKYWECLPYYNKIQFQTEIQQSPNPIEKCMEIFMKLTTSPKNLPLITTPLSGQNQRPLGNEEKSVVVVYGSKNQTTPSENGESNQKSLTVYDPLSNTTSGQNQRPLGNEERSVVVYDGSKNQTTSENGEGNQTSLVDASLDDKNNSSSQDYTSEEGNDDKSNDASYIDIAKTISYLLLSTALSHPTVLEDTTKVTENLIKKMHKKISNVKDKAIEKLKEIVEELIELTKDDDQRKKVCI